MESINDEIVECRRRESFVMPGAEVPRTHHAVGLVEVVELEFTVPKGSR